MEIQERGYDEIDGALCANCVNEPGLKDYISSHLDSDECFCCGAVGDQIACELESIAGHILACISIEWRDPDSAGVMYISREGGYQAPIYDTRDVLEHYPIDIQCDEVYERLVDAYSMDMWVRSDLYTLRNDQILFNGWRGFRDFVTNRVRYLFMQAKDVHYDPEQHDEMEPINILETLGRFIEQHELISIIDKDKLIRRVRIVNPDTVLSSAHELGTPESIHATVANRMSPAGIPMFYGGFDTDTCIAETYTQTGEEKKAVIATFKTHKELTLVDLSAIPPVPSPFDENNYHARQSIIFLNNFLSDFSMPADRKDRAHIDYVPTQIVTEYLRHLFTFADERIDGVIYPSAQNPEHKAIVLFIEHDQCSDPNNISSKTLLILDDIDEQILPANS